MTTRELAEVWKGLVKIYKETRFTTADPRDCIRQATSRYGREAVLETLAAVAALKIGDGRIYPENRAFLKNVEFEPMAGRWDNRNHLIYAGIDTIHTAHINQLIEALR